MGKGLDRVYADVEAGRLGIARDRLASLMRLDPTNLALRRLMGDINDRLGYPVEAGRWWFFEEAPSETQRNAIQTFCKANQFRLDLILRELRLRVLPDQFDDQRVRRRIEDMIAECERLGLKTPDLAGKAHNPRFDVGMIGCALGGVIIVVLALVGLVTVFRWLFP